MKKLLELQKNLPYKTDDGSIVDCMLIFDDINREYLTGLSNSNGFLVITKEEIYQLINFIYFEEASKLKINTILLDDFDKCLSKIIKMHNIKQIMIESTKMTVSKLRNLEKLCQTLDTKIWSNNDLDRMLKYMRMIKSDDEIKKIKESQRLTDEAFSYILKRINNNSTEKEIALDLEMFMRKNGAQRVAFDLIVASGKNGSLPHASVSNKKINEGDLITIDMGAVVDGYHSDMTRTVAYKSIGTKQKEIYDLVLKAQCHAINEAHAGKTCRELDLCARDIIYNAGFERCFGHATGHSLGLEIHEFPSISYKCKENIALLNNMIITIEPGIYIEGQFGIRIEDMVIINDKNPIDITKSTKELLII